MKLIKKLLSERFRADGRAAIPVGSEEKKALSSFAGDITERKILFSSHSECPLCEGTSGILVAEKDRLGISCRTAVCNNCGLVFNDSYLDGEDATRFYREYWGRIQWKGKPEKNFIMRTRPEAYTWKRFAFVGLTLGDNLRRLRTVFEFGCGDGCNLFPYYVAGKDVLGCDLDNDFLASGRMRGLDLRLGHSEVLEDCGEKADLIILSHVFEHMLDLDQAIENVKKLIKPRGYVYVEVPGLLNWNRPRADRLAEDGYSSTNNFLVYLQFVHNYHFDLYHLTCFWKRHGFKLVRGDEWVRAIFQYERTDEHCQTVNRVRSNDRNGKISIEAGTSSPQRVLQHLSNVERDFRSPTGRCYRLAGMLARRFGIRT